MAKKITTLYIDDTNLRLMVTKGKRIKKMADLPLQLGSTEVRTDIKETEVVTRIKHLLKANKVRTKKVIVGLSGLHCLSRPMTLPQLPKAMLAEAVKREAKRVLPVPLDQLYISWQTTPVAEGKIQVFLVAIPRRIADNALKVMHQAGLKPYLMDIKPLALARVVKEATAIIVDVQATEFDIVIMTNGIPQPIRTIPFPTEALSQQDRLSKITEDLSRTIEFYNSNNPEQPLTSSVPIFVSGELAEEPELCNSLSAELGHPVLPLSTTLKCPKNLDPTGYMVNIGLALKELTKEAGPLVVNINTLPAYLHAKPISLTRIAVIPTVAAVISLIVGGVMVIQSASANIASINDQLDMANHLLEQRQAKKDELKGNITELEQKIAGAEASCNSFTAVLDTMNNEGGVINGDLTVTTGSLLGEISLTQISHSREQLTIQGRAPNEEEILAYARALDDSDRFSKVTIASIRRVGDTEVAGEEIEGEGEEGEAEEGEAEESVSTDMNFTLVLKTGGNE